MKKKKHLTQEQRYTIFVLLQQGCNQSFIARTIGKDRSVVSREIKRNSSEKQGVYNYKTAQKKADFRKQRFHRRHTFTREKQDFVEEHLKKKWSPEQIVGYCKKNRIEMVSHETIYQYLREDRTWGGTLYTHLRHRLKHRKRPASGKHVVIKDKIGIELRPDIVERKERMGDWEIDTIVGKENKGAILTIVERKTGFLIAEKLQRGKNAKALAKTLVRLLLPFKEDVHTITSDNGSEFTEHKYIAKMLDAQFFFANPYSSWERGLNEYTNKLIRQYIPKGESFNKYNNKDIKQIQYAINKRPRKNLNFECPKKIFFASLHQNVAFST
ncbi:MAG: IS30 family transposase [Eubacteriales bacterium]|nr:IS30 family transposase [Eubacteriales bacterium]